MYTEALEVRGLIFFFVPKIHPVIALHAKRTLEERSFSSFNFFYLF